MRKHELEELTNKHEELEKKYENLVEEKNFTNNKIKSEIKSLVDKLIKKINTESNLKTSIIIRDVSFIYKSVLNLIDDTDEQSPDNLLNLNKNNTRNIIKPTDEINVQINNNNININNFSKLEQQVRSKSPPRSPGRGEFRSDSKLVIPPGSPSRNLNKSPTKESLLNSTIEKKNSSTSNIAYTPFSPNKNDLNTPNKKMKPFNYNYGSKVGQTNTTSNNTLKSNEKTTIIKNTKADPQKIIKSIIKTNFKLN